MCRILLKLVAIKEFSDRGEGGMQCVGLLVQLLARRETGYEYM